MKISIIFSIFYFSIPINGRLTESRNNRYLQRTFPSYSQQCRDDAGPPFADDAETFGPDRKYHFGTPAEPVLKDGKCADPLKNACDTRNDAKLAYLEGPISCGGNGWHCRILEDPNWPPLALAGDLNFGYCNTTEGFNDAGYDGSGHCHGSDSDETYYWWVRDHWFRGYNGHLKCCCNWENYKEGRIGNRCDFRRLVSESEDVNQCRDANEDHGMSFNGGCDASMGNKIGQPLEEDEAQCWEVTRFGAPEDDDGDGDGDGGNGDEDEDEPDEDADEGEGDEDEDEEECVDQELAFKNKKKKNCDWVGRKRRKRCRKTWNGQKLWKICPQACRRC